MNNINNEYINTMKTHILYHIKRDIGVVLTEVNTRWRSGSVSVVARIPIECNELQSVLESIFRGLILKNPHIMNLLRDTEPWHGIAQLSQLQANNVHDAVKLDLK